LGSRPPTNLRFVELGRDRHGPPRRRWTGRRERRCSPRDKRLERVVEDLELEGAVFLGILGIARRLVSRYEPLEALVDEPPYGCIDCGMQVVDGEGRVIGTVLIPPPVLN
jgi:hypothetical protein